MPSNQQLSMPQVVALLVQYLLHGTSTRLQEYRTSVVHIRAAAAPQLSSSAAVHAMLGMNDINAYDDDHC